VVRDSKRGIQMAEVTYVPEVECVVIVPNGIMDSQVVKVTALKYRPTRNKCTHNRPLFHDFWVPRGGMRG